MKLRTLAPIKPFALVALTALSATSAIAEDRGPLAFGIGNGNQLCLGLSCAFTVADPSLRDETNTADHRISVPTGTRDDSNVADFRPPPVRVGTRNEDGTADHRGEDTRLRPIPRGVEEDQRPRPVPRGA